MCPCSVRLTLAQSQFQAPSTSLLRITLRSRPSCLQLAAVHVNSGNGFLLRNIEPTSSELPSLGYCHDDNRYKPRPRVLALPAAFRGLRNLHHNCELSELLHREASGPHRVEGNFYTHQLRLGQHDHLVAADLQAELH